MRRWWSWGVSSSSHMTPLDWEKMVQHISQWNNCVPRAGNVECGEWRWMVMVIMMMSKWCWWCWYWYLNYQFSDIFLIALGCQLVLRLFRWQSSMFRFQPKKFNALHLKSLQKGESELGNLGFGLLFPVCSFQGWCNWDILVGQLDEWILATKYTLAATFPDSLEVQIKQPTWQKGRNKTHHLNFWKEIPGLTIPYSPSKRWLFYLVVHGSDCNDSRSYS